MGSWSRGGGRAAFTRMSWTWTGYDYDPVFRYKEEANFFQTGRNNAEARFWQTKVHEGDRRGTKSQIEIGSDGDSVKDHADVAKASSEDSASKDGDREYEEEEDDVRSLGDRDYQYGYGGTQNRDPGQRYFVYEETRHDGHKGRDRTMSIVGTSSRRDDWRSPSKDYQYSYGRDAVEVERPPPTRGSVERQRGSVERKVPRQSEERPRQSEERQRQVEERPRQVEERPREPDERYRQSEGAKREERQREPAERRSEEYERYKEPDDGRYRREVEEDRGHVQQRKDSRDQDEEGDRGRQKQSERIPDWDRRPNVNRRKVHGHYGQQCASGGDFTGSSYY